MTKHQLTIKIKRLGKKKIKTVDYLIDDIPKDLNQLLMACVKVEVQRYQDKLHNHALLSFLTQDHIVEQTDTGKVGLNSIKNSAPADLNIAQHNIIQAFNDGLFVVFIDDHEITNLHQPIDITEHSQVSFVRMTFLTGTLW